MYIINPKIDIVTFKKLDNFAAIVFASVLTVCTTSTDVSLLEVDPFIVTSASVRVTALLSSSGTLFATLSLTLKVLVDRSLSFPVVGVGKTHCNRFSKHSNLRVVENWKNMISTNSAQELSSFEEEHSGINSRSETPLLLAV